MVADSLSAHHRDHFRVATESGAAGLDVTLPQQSPVGLLVLGHGAGGGVDAPDLVTVHDSALRQRWAVARVTQPYRVLGRRSPAPAPRLDAAWVTVVNAARQRRGLTGVPIVLGGRSSGARVACRTAQSLGAVGVVVLAFPLHPPGRPQTDRSSELREAGVPVLVVQGDRDAFGSSADITALQLTGADIVGVSDADHSLRRASAINAVSVAVDRWLLQFSQ